MAGYSGETTFDYEVERYRHKETGALYPIDQVEKGLDQTALEWLEFTYEYVCIPLQVEGSSYYAPGRTWGPPENCYPDEGDTELISLTDDDGNDWEDKITESERDSIMDMIQENVMAGLDGPDPDDYYDRYDD